MKKVRSYSNVWSVEKVLYAINDVKLLFAPTFTQLKWGVPTFIVIVMFGEMPPLSFISSALLKYAGIPIAVAWFMSQKAFDGKKPFGFIKSVVTYFLRPKRTYAKKPVKYQKAHMLEEITAVRSEICDVSSEIH